MEGVVNRIADTNIDRRTLLGTIAAVSASFSLAGCAPELTETEEAKLPDTAEENGVWVPFYCNSKGCGGEGCINKVYLVDGVPVRQKTDDTHEDSPEYPQQRGCVRGRSMRHDVLGAHCLKYPMKRKNWQPGGGENAHGELRGKDEWERISWDEALDYVADETKRIYDTYGPRSVLVPGYSGGTTSAHFLAAMGGYCWIQDTASAGSFGLASLAIGTDFTWNMGGAFGGMCVNDRRDLLNSETVVLYGCNPSWAAAGNPTYWYMQAKNAGAEFIYVGPDYNVTASALQARWIRVRPGTDIAFLLAVAYTMITQDDPETNPLIDWDYIDRCTVGFYEKNMPADAKLNEHFMGYVMGDYDGVPKTPEWATEICGTPVEDIEWYANAIRKDRKVAIHFSYAGARTNDSEDYPQMLMTIGAMGGHYGKPGHACGLGAYLVMTGNEGPSLVSSGGTMPDGTMTQATSVCPLDEPIPAYNVWQSILDGKYRYCGNSIAAGTMDGIQPSEWRDIDIRMMWYEWDSPEKTPDVSTQVEVFRKMEFVVAQDCIYSSAAKYADIILPAASNWERYNKPGRGDRECFKVTSRVLEPMFERRPDQEIITDLMTRVGIDPTQYFPCSEKDKYFYGLAGATIVEPDGVTVSPLVTITQEDVDNWGVEWPLQEGKIGLEELIEQGSYQVKLSDGDNYGYIGYQAFREDPEANPRKSVSGKQEIYCQQKADKLNAVGFSDRELKPYPTYCPAHSGYESSFSDWSSKTKGDYPYQVFTPHYLGRCHNFVDQVKQIREAFISPVFINAQDADEKGVKDGDTLVLYNENGKVLRVASLSNCIMPGCISMPHGGQTNFDEENGVDRGGNENVLIGNTCGIFPVSGYNTTLVNFEKYDGEPLAPRHELTVVAPEV